VSQSQTLSPTVTATLTDSQTRSQSSSPTVSRTLSPTGSQRSTATQSMSTTQTPTASQSTSPLPLALLLVPTTDVIVSDSMLPVQKTLQLNRCPHSPFDASSVSVECKLDASPNYRGTSAGAPALFVSPAEPVSCTRGSDGTAARFSPPVALLMGVAFSASIGGAASDGRELFSLLSHPKSRGVTCSAGVRAFDAGPGTPALPASNGSTLVARASFDVVVLPTRWPLWSDAVVVFVSGGSCFARELTSGNLLNVTASLIDACVAEAGITSASPPFCTVVGALAQSSVVLAALSAAAAAREPFDGRSSEQGMGLPRRPFLLTLSGPTLLGIWSNVSGAFSANTTVSLQASGAWATQRPRDSSVLCNTSGVSSDGRWLLLTTPAYSELCTDRGSASCGYQVLAVTNPSETSEYASSASGSPAVDVAGATLPCPPFCDSLSLPTGAFPYPQADEATGSVSFVPAQVVRTGDLYALPDVTVLPSAAAPSGIYYTKECSATTRAFNSPLTGTCTNESHPESYGCAYGEGDDCSACPDGGLCPGGYRLWSRPAWWVASEASRTALRCSAPATERCTGWDAAAGTTACGTGYHAGSYLCGTCSPGYYDPGDGTCLSCPANPGVWEKYKGLLGLVIGVFLFVLLVFCALLVVIRIAGGTLAALVRRVAALVVWALLAVQTLSLVARDSSSASLPAPLRAFYESVSVLSLQVRRLKRTRLHT
jgi:hypothetical protein